MKIKPDLKPRVASIAVGALALILLSGFTALDDSNTGEAANASDPDGIPVAGTFEHFQDIRAEGLVIRGAVHAVQRVPGGTALYYSVGTPPGSGENYRGSMSFRSWPGRYHGVTGEMYIADVKKGELYRPMYEEGSKSVTSTYDLEANEGELITGFAMFPELDPATEYVQVAITEGYVIDVRVGEGALTPIADEPGSLLGEGWPELPSESDLDQLDAAYFIRKISQRFEDIEGTARIEEFAEEVQVALDANVVFAIDKWDISAKAESRLDSIAADIVERGTGEVLIVGHTDSVGSTEHNQKLSERRAGSVEKYLKGAVGGADVTFKAEGKGKTDPIASNSDEEGRAQNRRVEITYQVVEPQ